MRTQIVQCLTFANMALGFMLQNVDALSLTKKKVYVSTRPIPNDSWATWNDSTSLINTTSDTLILNALYFKVPNGYYAELEIGLNVPYRKDGNISGAVVNSNQNYTPFPGQLKPILPNARIPITGFWVASCIQCPVGQNSGSGNSSDTLSMLLVFETKVSLDTLIIIGPIAKAFSSMVIAPVSPNFKMENNNGPVGNHYFNILGQFFNWSVDRQRF